MLGRRILAGMFAVIILVKLLFWITAPNLWMGAVTELLAQQALVTIIYLGLLVITGYYVFTRLNLMDVALVMFFTSILLALSLLPYAGVFLRMREEIMALGVGRAWPALVLWGGLAALVLHKVLAPEREQPD